MMPVVELNDIEMYYEVKGEGRPVFLVAGLMSDSQSWVPVSDYLAEKYMVITPDNRCCGRTVTGEAECSVRLMAKDVLALADSLGLERFDIVGHSMGGFIVLELASIAPERVSSMVLEATSAASNSSNDKRFREWLESLESGQDIREWYAEIFKWIFTENVTGNSVTMDMFLDYSVNYPYAQSKSDYKKQIQAIAEFDGRGLVSDIQARTLILCAERDLLFAVNESISELSLLPHNQVSVIEGAAHALHAEKPDEFVRVVADFIG